MCNKPVFRNYLLAGYPLLWVESYEDSRVITRFLQEANDYKVYSWDLLRGVRQHALKDNVPQSIPLKSEEPIDELGALQWAEKNMESNSVLILRNYHKFVKNIPVFQGLKNLADVCRSSCKTIVILSPVVDIPVELEKDITVIRFELPDKDDLRLVLKSICSDNNLPAYTENDDPLLQSALGMTVLEAENAFAFSLASNKGKFSQEIIQQKKADVVKKTGLLEVIDVDVTLDDVGGADKTKEWLTNRGKCFTDSAHKFGIKPPKGVLFVGPPGTGKSLLAKAIANFYKRPLLRLDMGKVFGSLVGESESNLRKCLAIAEAVSPSVLWIDELEKAFAGVKGESNDGHGTAKRCFGNFLTWLSEKTSDVFIVATANEVESLPPALLRGGRFDAIFWVDLPSTSQRAEILKIHLKKVGREFSTDGIAWLAQACEGYSGAEIEVWVQESLVRAFSDGQELNTKIMHAVLPEITSISKLMSAEIKKSQEWAIKQGVKSASSKEEVKVETAQKRKIGLGG